PADPAPHLVVVQPRLAVAGLEHLLDAVPLALRADDLFKRHLGAGVGQGVVGSRLAHRTDHDQPLFRSDTTVLLGSDSHDHRIARQRTPLARADLDPLPSRLRLARRPVVGSSEGHLPLAATPGMTTPRTPTLKVTHRGIARHVEDITFLATT